LGLTAGNARATCFLARKGRHSPQRTRGGQGRPWTFPFWSGARFFFLWNRPWGPLDPPQVGFTMFPKKKTEIGPSPFPSRGRAAPWGPPLGIMADCPVPAPSKAPRSPGSEQSVDRPTALWLPPPRLLRFGPPPADPLENHAKGAVPPTWLPASAPGTINLVFFFFGPAGFPQEIPTQAPRAGSRPPWCGLAFIFFFFFWSQAWTVPPRPPLLGGSPPPPGGFTSAGRRIRNEWFCSPSSLGRCPSRWARGPRSPPLVPRPRFCGQMPARLGKKKRPQEKINRTPNWGSLGRGVSGQATKSPPPLPSCQTPPVPVPPWPESGAGGPFVCPLIPNVGFVPVENPRFARAPPPEKMPEDFFVSPGNPGFFGPPSGWAPKGQYSWAPGARPGPGRRPGVRNEVWFPSALVARVRPFFPVAPPGANAGPGLPACPILAPFAGSPPETGSAPGISPPLPKAPFPGPGPLASPPAA